MRGLQLTVFFGFLVLPLTVGAQADIMKVSDVTSAPGSAVTVIVFLTHDEPIQGFQTSLVYENAVFTLNGISTTGLDVEILLLPDTIEFFVTDEDPNIQPGLGWGGTGAVFDFGPPFDNQQVPPGPDRSIVAYQFTSAADPMLLGTCSTVQLVSGLGSPPIFNVITVNGVSQTPALQPGDVCFEPLPVFRRGDANSDGSSNIADAVFIIQYLFQGGPTPLCLDSADANNDNLLDVSDVVRIINYNFSGGPPPANPFPNCGTEGLGDISISCLLYPPC